MFIYLRTKEGAKQVLEMLISGPKSYVSHNFKPEMMRLVPPLYVSKDEVSIKKKIINFYFHCNKILL